MARKSPVVEKSKGGEPYVKYKKSGKTAKMTKAEFASCVRKVSKQKGITDAKRVCGATTWGIPKSGRKTK